jgi:hypothetical protein
MVCHTKSTLITGKHKLTIILYRLRRCAVINPALRKDVPFGVQSKTLQHLGGCSPNLRPKGYFKSEGKCQITCDWIGERWTQYFNSRLYEYGVAKWNDDVDRISLRAPCGRNHVRPIFFLAQQKILDNS